MLGCLIQLVYYYYALRPESVRGLIERDVNKYVAQYEDEEDGTSISYILDTSSTASAAT